MVYFDGSMLLEYEFNAPVLSRRATPEDHATKNITADFDGKSGPCMRYTPKGFPTIRAALYPRRVTKVRIRTYSVRGGGGFSTPDDATLMLDSGERVSTSREIAMSLAKGEPKEICLCQDAWTGAGWYADEYQV